MPHAPQLASFIITSTHPAVQESCPIGHWQVLFWQVCPPWQTTLQLPQLSLALKSVQVSPQAFWPVGQAHWPALQV
jgi:hypothetical protein